MQPETPQTNLDPLAFVPPPLPPQPVSPDVPAGPVQNSIWSKQIFRMNFITICVCLGFLLFIDLPILIGSPDLKDFFFMMLIAFGALLVLTVLERIAGKRLSEAPTNGIDMALLTLIIVRNIIVILNVIPLIQLLGMLSAVFIAPLILIAEIILVAIRLNQRSRSSLIP